MKQNFIKLNSIAEGIEAIKNGEVIIVVDDANRENEGDFIAAAEKITPELINFMATHGRGSNLCPFNRRRCQDFIWKNGVQQYRSIRNSFTVSVDLKGKGVTTGISAADRAQNC